MKSLGGQEASKEAVTVQEGKRLEHADAALGLAYSPDGQRLASAGRDGRVVVWDARNGNPLHALDLPTLALPGLAGSVAFNPDGRQLLIQGSNGTDGVWLLWDLESGKTQQFPFPDPKGMHPGKGQLALAGQGDSRVALVDDRGKVWVLDRIGGKKVAAFFPVESGEGKDVRLAFCPAGRYARYLATWEAGERRVRVWDPKDYDPSYLRANLPEASAVEGLAVDRRGLRLAVNGGTRVWVLDLAAAGQPEAVLDLEGGERASSQAFSPDGTLLALGGREKIRLWGVKERRWRDSLTSGR
jgi:WD40 repeat protein